MSGADWGRLVLLGAIWGGSYLFIRIAAPVLGVFLTMGLRVMIAAMALSFYAYLSRQLPRSKRWRDYLLLGFLNNAVPFVLIAIAVINLNASVAAILNATTPLFTAVVAALWLREPLGTRKLGGLVLGIIGVGILVGWSPLPLSAPVLLGGLCALVAAGSYGIAAVYARRTFRGDPPVQTALGQLTGSSLLLLPLMLAAAPIATVPTAGVVGAVGLLAVACTAAAYLLYFQLIATAGATPAATVTLLIPIFSVVFGSLFLGEPVTAGLLLGLITILLSIWLVIGAE